MIATELDQERRKLEDVNHPQHVAAVEGLSDYLTIMNLLYKSISRILEGDCSLTTLQYRMLLRLLSAPRQTMRSTDLAANLRVGVSTVSAAVPHLVDEGLVTRAEDPDDMRVVSLALTRKGSSANGRITMSGSSCRTTGKTSRPSSLRPPSPVQPMR